MPWKWPLGGGMLLTGNSQLYNRIGWTRNGMMITFACASPSSSSYCVVIRQIFSPFPPIKFNPAGVCYATLNFKRIFFSIFKRGPSSRTSFRHCWPCHRSDLRTYMSDGVSSQRAGIEPAGCIRCKVECLIFLYIYNIYSR